MIAIAMTGFVDHDGDNNALFYCLMHECKEVPWSRTEEWRIFLVGETFRCSREHK